MRDRKVESNKDTGFKTRSMRYVSWKALGSLYRTLLKRIEYNFKAILLEFLSSGHFIKQFLNPFSENLCIRTHLSKMASIQFLDANA